MITSVLVSSDDTIIFGNLLSHVYSLVHVHVMYTVVVTSLYLSFRCTYTLNKMRAAVGVDVRVTSPVSAMSISSCHCQVVNLELRADTFA